MDEAKIKKHSNQYCFSFEVVKRFFQRYRDRTIPLIESLKKPGKFQALRINTIKITPSNFKKKMAKLGEKITIHPKLEEIAFLEVKGPFTIKGTKKVVVANKEAAESVLTGTNLYAPGVKRAGKIKPGDNVSIYDMKNNHVANGIAMMSAREMLESKKGISVDIKESIYKVKKLRDTKLFEEGLVYSQSLPAAVTSRNLNPQKNDLVIDLCAAPGGKTTHVAQLMKNQGKIISIDRSKPRIRQLKENIKRLSLKNVQIFTNKELNYVKEEYRENIDKILVDPPCSSLGIRPKLYDMTSLKEILDCAKYQKNFLHIAHELLKPDGILIYSTCTLEPEENEMNIKYAVKKLNFELIEQNIFLGTTGELIEGLDYKKLQRFYSDLHDQTGYFIAKLRKK